MQIIILLTTLIAAIAATEVLPTEIGLKSTEPIVKHLQIGETHYVDAGKSHYGFTREDNGIFKTVSVIGDKVVVWLPDCTIIIRTWAQLNRVDRKAVREAQKTIAKAYRDFANLDTGKETILEIYKSTNEPNPNQTNKVINDHGAVLIQHAHSDIVEYDEREASLVGGSLPPSLMRAFVLKKIFGYVYNDRFVIVKPRWCQFKDDADLLQTLRMKY